MGKKDIVKTTDTQAGEFLKRFGKSLENYAMRKYDHSIFLKSAMIAIVNNSNLVDCLKSDAGKMSLFNAMRYAATTGLSLNPQEGKAALVSYKNKKGEAVVNYQIMKNGMLDLALESGKIEFITADYVKENDVFSIKKTVNGDEYNFIPAVRDRGDIIGFFAALKLKGGATHVKWMTVEEIEDFRDKYSSTYKFNPENSPWGKSFIGMGVKTIMKALLRNIRISDDLDRAIGSDDFYEADFHVESEPGISADDAAKKLKDNDNQAPSINTESQGSLL